MASVHFVRIPDVTPSGRPSDRLAGPKISPKRLQLVSALRQIASVSNHWLAQRLQMGAPTGVSSFVYRFQASGGTRTRSFRAAVEPFAT
jgi:hypothetical protein